MNDLSANEQAIEPRVRALSAERGDGAGAQLALAHFEPEIFGFLAAVSGETSLAEQAHASFAARLPVVVAAWREGIPETSLRVACYRAATDALRELEPRARVGEPLGPLDASDPSQLRRALPMDQLAILVLHYDRRMTLEEAALIVRCRPIVARRLKEQAKRELVRRRGGQ